MSHVLPWFRWRRLALPFGNHWFSRLNRRIFQLSLGLRAIQIFRRPRSAGQGPLPFFCLTVQAEISGDPKKDLAEREVFCGRGEIGMNGEKARDMQPDSVLDNLPAKSRRRIARKPAKGLPAKKFKVTYYLTAQAIERVGVAATMEHLDKSEVVERLIHDHLRKWVVSCRGPRTEELDEEIPGAGGRSLAG